MTAAINGNPKENDNARTYGAIFINYHPYYYRGVAYLNTGKYEQAIADFEKTSGPGEADLGSIDDADVARERRSSRKPTRRRRPNRSLPRRSRASCRRLFPFRCSPPRRRSIPRCASARTRRSIKPKRVSPQRMQRKAGNTPQYAQATQALTDALTRSGNARSNDDLNAAIASAQNAATIADLAPAPGAPRRRPRPFRRVPRKPAPSSSPTPHAASATRSKATSAANSKTPRKSSAPSPTTCPRTATSGPSSAPPNTRNTPSKPTTATKTQAMESFRKAKTLRKWNGGLPPKYFSKRIRKVFDSAS